MAVIHELRCTLWLEGAEVLLDADLLVGEHGSPIQLESLATGAVIWNAHTPGHFEAAAWRWLTRRLASWELDPLRLPDQVVAEEWGRHLARCLADGVGPEVLDELLARRAKTGRVRLVFRALDRATIRLPYETLVWPVAEKVPLVADHARCVSVLRVADRIPTARATPPVGARHPGIHRARVQAALGPDADTRFADPLAAVLAGAGATGAEPIKRLDPGAVRGTDLLLVCGHGDARRGLELGEGERADASDFGLLGEVVDSAILAMCGSAAEDPPVDEASPALALARAGAGPIVGFQGDVVDLDNVRLCVDELVRVLSPALAGETRDALVTLELWEDALAAGRHRIHDAATVPVAYVHPAQLLAGAARDVALRRSAPWQWADEDTVPVTVIPWYVPGQLVRLSDGDQMFRVPVPVDVGRLLDVAVVRGTDSRVDGKAYVGPADLDELAARFDFPPDRRIALVCHAGTTEPRDLGWWGARSAELSAIIRALTTGRRLSIPPAVRKLLDEAVRQDWGAHDAAPRLVEIDSGRAVRHLASAWPPLEAEVARTRLPYSVRPVTAAKDARLAAISEAGALERIRQALTDARAVVELVREQAEAIRTAPRRGLINDPDLEVIFQDALRNARDVIAVPAAARLLVTAAGDGRIHLTGVQPRRADAPDDLDY
jgi:hypothetical protein